MYADQEVACELTLHGSLPAGRDHVLIVVSGLVILLVARRALLRPCAFLDTLCHDSNLEMVTRGAGLRRGSSSGSPEA